MALSSIDMMLGIGTMQTTKQSKIRAITFVMAASVSALSLTGCASSDPGTRVAGWALIDPAQRHPILVSQEPTVLTLHVARGTSGLTARQRGRLYDFYSHYRATDAGNSRLIISAPGGSHNEIAAMHLVRQIRYFLTNQGIADSDIVVEAYHAEGDPQPPIKVSYLRHVAHAPECGQFPTNLSNQPANLPYPNLGCASQRNLAMQVANPADLISPRNMTPRSSERRDTVFNKYTKGDTTSAERTNDERVDTQGSN